MTQRSPFISLLIPGRIFKSQGKTEPPTKMAIMYHQRQTSNIPHGFYQSDKERSDQNLEKGKKVSSTGPTQNAKKKKKQKEKEFEKRRGRRRRKWRKLQQGGFKERNCVLHLAIAHQSEMREAPQEEDSPRGVGASGQGGDLGQPSLSDTQ